MNYLPRKATTRFDAFAIFTVLGFMVIGFAPYYALSRNVEGSQSRPLDQLAFGILYLGTAFFFVRRSTGTIRIYATDIAIWLLVLLSAVSTLWSSDPNLTLRRVVALCGTTLFAYYLATALDPKSQLRLLAVAMSGLVLVNLAISIFFPAVGQDDVARWTGFFNTKNELGRAASFAAIIALVVSLGSRGITRVYFASITGLAVALVIFADSLTALVVLLMTLCAYSILRATALPKWLFTFFCTALLSSMTAFALWVTSDVERAASSAGRDATLTGRTSLWELSLMMIREKPWVGYGYHASWLEDAEPARVIWQRLTWEPPHAHNGFLDITLDLGVVGLCLFIFVLAVSLVRSYRLQMTNPNVLNAWPFTLLSFLLLYNISENTLLRPHSVIWVAFVATAVSLARVEKSNLPAVLYPGAKPVSHDQIGQAHGPVPKSGNVLVVGTSNCPTLSAIKPAIRSQHEDLY